MEKIWKFLNGKKTNIALIASCVLTWCVGRGWIAADTAAMISTVLASVGLGHKLRKAGDKNG